MLRFSKPWKYYLRDKSKMFDFLETIGFLSNFWKINTKRWPVSTNSLLQILSWLASDSALFGFPLGFFSDSSFSFFTSGLSRSDSNSESSDFFVSFFVLGFLFLSGFGSESIWGLNLTCFSFQSWFLHTFTGLFSSWKMLPFPKNEMKHLGFLCIH